MEMETNIKIAAAAVGGLVLGIGLSSGIGIAPGVLHAQSNAPYYNVAAINVTNKDAYEASGVDKVRDAIKENGGKVIAGGYLKAVAIDSDVPAANRFLIFVYPNKEASDKANEVAKTWAEKVKGKYTDRYRVYGVEGVESK
jgi:hypothetical protein